MSKSSYDEWYSAIRDEMNSIEQEVSKLQMERNRNKQTSNNNSSNQHKPQMITEASTAASSNSSSASYSNSNTTKPREMICYEWKFTSACKRGDRCRFTHTNNNNNNNNNNGSNNQKPQVNKPNSETNLKNYDCSFWMKDGKCRNGDKCKFNHPIRKEGVSRVITESSLQLENKSTAVYDTGDSKHMSPFKEYFINLVQLSHPVPITPAVKNSAVMAEYEGDLQLTLEDGSN